MRSHVAIIALLLALGACNELPRLNIDDHAVTTSGISSGAFMAVQMGTVYSALFNGFAAIAGGPYYCAQANVELALTQCMTVGTDLINVPYLAQITRNTAMFGFADPVSNLKDDRVWLLSALNDTIVDTTVVEKLESWAGTFVSSDNIKAVYNVEGEHVQLIAGWGDTCTKLGTPYINNCDYDAAGELLQWLYHEELSVPNGTAPTGQLIEFDQAAFLGGEAWSVTFGLAQTAWVYVPPACAKGSTCRLHVAFHGCEMTPDDIGTKYVEHGGYNPWADANNIVVLYPQATSNALNPKGCWDWWGYSGVNYASNTGVQASTVRRIIDHVMGQDL
jgi:poly(3-hydroxybutyrate) depolymerase